MIIGEIRRYLRDNNMVRVSRSIRDLAYKVIQSKEKLIRENGKEPTIEEIAKDLNVDKEEMTYNGSGLFIQVGDYVRFGNDVRETRSLRYQYIYPEPSYFHSGVIAYIGDDLRKVLANRKIIFQAEDVQLKNKDEREGFVSSVLLGSLLGFILTVIVEIFSKWKRVNDNERKRHST